MNSRDTLLLMEALLAILIKLGPEDPKLRMALAHRIGELQVTTKAEKI